MGVKIRKIGLFLLNLIELYIPIVTFLTMFVVFIVQIFFRYILNQPLTWSMEATSLAYLWTVLLAAGYARRKRQHVSFSMVYDKRSPRNQIKMRLIGNFIVIVTFCILAYPAYDYVSFMSIQSTPVLDIPFNIAFIPFLIMIVTIVGHSIYDFVIDIRKLKIKDYERSNEI